MDPQEFERLVAQMTERGVPQEDAERAVRLMLQADSVGSRPAQRERAPEPEPQEPSGPRMSWKGAALTAIEDLGWGWGDEALGLVPGVNRDAVRQEISDFREAAPWWLEGGIGLAAAAPSAMVGGLLAGGAKAAARGVSTTLGRRMLRGAGYGAVNAGVDAAGRGNAETLGGRAVNAAAGAGLGAVLGGALPAAGASVGYGANRLSTLTNPEAQEQLARRVMLERIAQEGGNFDEIAKRVAKADTEDALIDFMPLGVRGQAEGAYWRAGKPTAATERLVGRMRNEASRVIDAIQGATGFGRVSGQQFVDDYTKSVRAVARPLYESAYQTPYAMPRRLMQKLEDMPGGGRILAEAVDMAKADGRDLSRYIVVDGEGSARIARAPDVEASDYIKRVLDRRSGARRRAQQALGDTEWKPGEYQWDGLRREIRQDLVDNVDDYGRALAVYSGGASERAAFEAGRDMGALTRPKTDILYEWNQLKTQPERQLFRMGLATRLQDRVGQVRSQTRDVSKLIFGAEETGGLAPDYQEVFNTVFGPEGTEQLLAALRRSRTMTNVGQQIMGNSATMGRQVEARELDLAMQASPVATAVGNTLERGPINSIGRGFNALAQAGTRRMGQEITRNYVELPPAEAWNTMTSGIDPDEIMAGLLRRNRRDAAGSILLSRVGSQLFNR